MNKTNACRRVALNNVLFLTDFSWASAWAIPFVRDIAKEYDARVTALHVDVADALTYMTPESLCAALETRQDVARAEMKRLEMKLDGVRCGTQQLLGIQQAALHPPGAIESLRDHQCSPSASGPSACAGK